MNRWHITKDRTAGDYPCPWYLTRDNWEDLDPNTELASIEGGSFHTFDEAVYALNEALRLDMHVITELPL